MQDMNEISIWPNSNYFLYAGLKAIDDLCFDVDLKKDYIFVDFSSSNLRYFTNSTWIEILKSTDMKIILICDSIIEPLAEYWRIREKRIFSVIYADYKINKIMDILTLSKYYSSIPCHRKTKRLEKKEVSHIDLSIRGLSPIMISKALNIPVKQVYNIKQTIKRKLKKDINKIMLSH